MVTVLTRTGGCGPVQCYPTHTPTQNPRLVRAITVKVTRVAQAKPEVRLWLASQVLAIPIPNSPKAKSQKASLPASMPSRAGKTLVVRCKLRGLVHSFELQLKQDNGANQKVFDLTFTELS